MCIRDRLKSASNVVREKMSRFDPIWTQLQAAGYLIFQLSEDIAASGYNFVLLAHAYDVTNSDGVVQETVPEIIGSSKKNVLKHFNEVVYFRKVGKRYMAYPRGFGLSISKTRTQSLKDMKELENPTFERFYGNGNKQSLAALGKSQTKE